MRKLIIGLFALAVLAVPAQAQAQRRGNAAEPPSPEEIQKKRDQAELDHQYKNALKRTSSDNAAATRVDPWANMRGANDAKR